MKNRFSLPPRTDQLKALRSQGWRVVTYREAPVVVAWQINGPESRRPGRVCVQAWVRKCDNPAFHYGFPTETAARRHVENFVAGYLQSNRESITRKSERAAKQAALRASDHWEVGDVMSYSWGYDQTNVDWFEVVAVKAKSIVIREIAQNANENGLAFAGTCQPRRGEFCGKPIVKMLDEDGGVGFDHGCGRKWDGKAKYCSSYA